MKWILKINRFLTIFGLFVMLNACSEYLDQLPQDQYTSDLVYKTQTDFTLAVNALYDFLPFLDQRWGESRLWLWTDDGWRRNGGREGSELNWDSNERFLDFYRYDEVRQCNEVINRIADAEIPAQMASRLEAEARFIRAMLYERMVFMHGDVPLVKEPQGPGFFPQRDNRLDVFNFVVDEFTAVSNTLPESFNDANLGRVTKWAALAMLSRTYLNALGWHPDPASLYDGAEAICREIIDNGPFALDEGIDGFSRLFMPDSDFEGGSTSSATILSRVYIENLLWYEEMAYKCLPRGSYRGTGEGVGNNQAQFGATWNIVRAFQTSKGLDPADDPDYDETDPFVNRDPRLRASLIVPGDTLQVRGGGGQEYYTFQPHPDAEKGSRDDKANRNTGIDTGYLIRKYTGLSLEDNATQTYINPRRGDADYKIIRYAEILLMMAECLAADNNPESLNYVNMIRERVGMPAYNSIADVPLSLSSGTTGNDYLDAVLLERRYEFVGEAPMRMTDIWRYRLGDQVYGPVEGIPEDVTKPGSLTGPYTTFAQTNRQWDDRYYLIPIPLRALDVNPNLENNPGW